MKYLVTGANGYIGSHLTHALLQRGHTVNALILPGTDPSKLSHKDVKIVRGDVRNPRDIEKAAAGCEAIFHLASLVSQWNKNPNAFYEVNVKGTQNLLEVCQKKGVKRVLISSSCGVFGASQNNKAVNERSDKSNYSRHPYERSKYQQVEAAKKYLDGKLEIVFVYPTRVLGLGVKSEGNSITAIIEGVVDGSWKIIPGNGRNYGNYIYVQDVVKGMMLVMANAPSGEDYILSGEHASYNDLFRMIQEITGVKRKLIRLPYPLLWLAGFAAESIARWTGQKPIFTTHAAKKYTADWLASNQKIRRELDFSPTPLTEAIWQTIEEVQKQKATVRMRA